MRAVADQQGIEPTPVSDGASQRTVAVVGAGITGLVTAYALQRRGINVTLYEASTYTGGSIRTSHVDGFLAEHGPNSFLTSDPVESLLAELDLTDDVVEANQQANRRFIVRNATLREFPMSPPAMLSTKLFSVRAKLRVLLEPLVRAAPAEGDESIASFVRRRLGREVLDFAVDPFVSGIFAGDPEMLSMAHAFPRVVELEKNHGSISAGLLAQRRKARGSAAAPSPDTAPAAPDSAPATTPRLVSFLDGMQTFTDALTFALGPAVRVDCPVRLLHRQGTRWSVEAGPDGAASVRVVDAVVMATPAHVLAAMELPASMRALSAPVEQVQYPPMSTLTLGFLRSDVGHPLDGFGMLIPALERRGLLGALFTSSLFPSRAPDGYVTITCFVGGVRMPERARENTDMLVERVLNDLRQLLQITGEPVFAKHVFWPRAIPQYTTGYQTVKDAADSTERNNPGLYLAGNYRHGVSVGDCVANGEQTAERVASYISHSG